MAHSYSPSSAARVEQEVCRDRLDQLIRARNHLIVQQNDAKLRSSNIRKQAKSASLTGNERKRRKGALPAGDGRYEALNQTRDINVKLTEWEQNFNKHLAAYSRAICLPIASDVQTHLPREVRDLIYKHMLDCIASRNPNHRPSLLLSSQDQPKKMWNIISPTFPFAARWRTSATTSPHYEDSTFVGVEFAKELLQMYYQECHFTIHEEEFGILDTLLQQEPRGYGIRIGQMIMKLQLTVGPKHCIAMDENMHYKVQFEETKLATEIQTQRLEEQLAPLLHIETRCKIWFNIWIWRGRPGLFQFGAVVGVLLPIIEALKGRGCSVDVAATNFTLETFGSTTAYATWHIQDTDKEPINRRLRLTMEEFHLPGMGGLGQEKLSEFEARFVRPDAS